MRVKRRSGRSRSEAPPAWAVLAVGLVITLGVGLPSPGLDLSPGAALPADRVLDLGPSLLELGLKPILGVLVLIELAKLAAPRWIESVAGKAEPASMPLPSIVGLAALGVATVEAARYYRALDEIEALSGGGLAALAGIASLVAGTALLIWLADRIRLPGLDRSGLWVVYALMAVGIVPYDLWNAIDAARAGMVPPWAIGAVLLAAVVAIVAIVFMRLTMLRALVRSGVDPLVWSPVLLWPPVVAAWIVGTLVVWLERAAVFDGASVFRSDLALVTTLATTVLTPAILLLYARAIAQRAPGAARWRGRRVILALLALLQTALCLAALGFWATEPFATQGPELIVVAIVAHTLWLEWRSRAAGESAIGRLRGR